MPESVDPVIGKGPSPGPITNPKNPLPESPLAGSSSVGAAVTGTASNGHPGVSGTSEGGQVTTGTNEIPIGDGVLGTGLNGIHGVSSLNNGVLGEHSGSGNGVKGQSATGFGVFGTSAGDGVHGESSGAGFSGVAGINSGAGHGIFGQGSTGDGVHGESSGVGASGVAGINSEGGHGISGLSVSGFGVYGSSAGDGVHGESSGAGTSGVAGINTAGGHGVYGRSSGTGFAGYFDGNVNVTGDVILAGADCAEEFDSAAGLEPGTVAVLDDNSCLSACTRDYDQRVVGVISGAGAFRPAIVLDRRLTTRHRAPIALIGKVYCKVDASYGPISVGDLLTTSATSGHARRASDPSQAFGAVIGKALASYDDGRGLIPVLVRMQ